MGLYRTYIKLLLLKNKFSYLYSILSITVSFIIISSITLFIDHILIDSSYLPMQNLNYIYESIQTIFCIAGVTYVIYQYYRIMKSSTQDYRVLKSLGASKLQIRLLIMIQALFMIVLTIPAGLLIGAIGMDYLYRFLQSYIDDIGIDYRYSSIVFIVILVSTSLAILVIGIDLEKGIRRIPSSQMRKEKTAFGKEA